jgi:hypothetical protein
VAAVPARAEEPLVGTWRLESQEITGQKSNFQPLTLKISQAGNKLAFAFSVQVNDAPVVSVSYALLLDGSDADIKGAKGEKLGTIQMRAAGASQYKLGMKGSNRPDSVGKLTVSTDGKTLLSESDAILAGRSIHSRQVFARE